MHITKMKFALYTLAAYLFASSNIITACCSRHSKSRQRKTHEAIRKIIENEPDKPSIYKKLMPYKEYAAPEPLSEWDPIPFYYAIWKKKNHATIFCLEHGASAEGSEQYSLPRYSPLCYAVHIVPRHQPPYSCNTKCDARIVKTLLKYNADPTKLDPVTHKSPLEHARLQGDLAVVKLMKNELAARTRWSDLRSAWVGTVVRVAAGPKAPKPVCPDKFSTKTECIVS